MTVSRVRGREIIEIKINGGPFPKVATEFSLPTAEKPYWTIILQNGNVLYATGQVSIEIEGKQGIVSEKVKAI
jgi:hypothetical protein